MYSYDSGSSGARAHQNNATLCENLERQSPEGLLQSYGCDLAKVGNSQTGIFIDELKTLDKRKKQPQDNNN
jgi:hypothetical protein